DPRVGAAPGRPPGRADPHRIQGVGPHLDRARLVVAGPVGGRRPVPARIRAGRGRLRAVGADPGWTFVVADAGQLEPRVLAAVSGDGRLARAASAGDLYAALAAEAFNGDRARAK